MTETTNIIFVLDPTAKSSFEEASIVPRVNDLNGKVIGFLWNGKPNGDILLRRVKEQLSKRFCLAGTVWQEVLKPVEPAETAAIEELTRTSDLVIIASAD
ncbi:hypothetical protein ACFLXK_03680 [Chloroflexota bacterium]